EVCLKGHNHADRAIEPGICSKEWTQLPPNCSSTQESHVKKSKSVYRRLFSLCKPREALHRQPEFRETRIDHSDNPGIRPLRDWPKKQSVWRSKSLDFSTW